MIQQPSSQNMHLKLIANTEYWPRNNNCVDNDHGDDDDEKWLIHTFFVGLLLRVV